ncbi:ARM repeat-containing protein [Microthyrium microscopicum]|uniref:ARM repeat-containing protein n=1 Tax=Microthyrium microscopicum TaxID=703497 RepID=A0A6A6UL37_9PEZI|nr:ARM repeat-containing protein [Microthyrium microscopicum]
MRRNYGARAPATPTADNDWEASVHKIVTASDQQQSIFMQQKIKSAGFEEKYRMCEAIVGQCLALASNRFGNFLVQRCLEHGTPEQIVAVAKALCTHIVQLSKDSFGCHVIQKAFDIVPEQYKATFVNEMLTDIRQTVVHRYACHVWQKLFELRWKFDPPQIMITVNMELDGNWTDVAMGETGSLVVQNIFENCLDDDKRPCIEEVLQNIDTISRGQFGNWCIQHICENGADADRDRAIGHILSHAADYSTDQYASKVVEKCLKVGGSDFLEEYLNEVCEQATGRTRSALIDIASDQYGNYLIQWVISNSSPEHRDRVISQIRKHMVSLRGSKYGSRVAMLCTNPQSHTRPGPPAGLPAATRYNNGGNYNSTRGGGSNNGYRN